MNRRKFKPVGALLLARAYGRRCAPRKLASPKWTTKCETAAPGVFEEWNSLLWQMEAGDEIVAYSDVDVYGGFCGGDEGFGLLRAGKLVAKIVMAIIN